MSQSARFNLTTPEKKTAWLPCGQCNSITSHRIWAELNKSDESPNDEIQIWDDYQIVQCLGCHNASFRLERSTPEDYEMNENTGENTGYAVTREIYPRRIAGRAMIEDALNLPEGVYKIYSETHGAFCSGYRVMAGFGIRAMVEAVCKDQGVTSGKLFEQIDELRTKALITPAGASILHSLRFMGNVAVHEMKAHTDEEISAAMQVAENLLENVYVIPSLAAKLPKKKP